MGWENNEPLQSTHTESLCKPDNHLQRRERASVTSAAPPPALRGLDSSSFDHAGRLMQDRTSPQETKAGLSNCPNLQRLAPLYHEKFYALCFYHTPHPMQAGQSLCGDDGVRLCLLIPISPSMNRSYPSGWRFLWLL